MAKFPKLKSADGRVERVVTSEDELELLLEQGYKRVNAKHDPATRELIDSGAEGNQRARASSTTEGQERNTGSTAPSAEEKAAAAKKAAEKAAKAS